jgi:hypothetical protein
MNRVKKTTKSRIYFRDCISVEHQIEFYAMRRSGHHAIIEWLFYQINNPVFFVNDIEPVISNKNYKDSGVWKNPIISGEYSTQLKTYAFNYEDAPIETLESNMQKYYKQCTIKKPKKISKIFIIRDPFNLFASRLKFFKEKKKKNISLDGVEWLNDKAINRWCDYAEEFLGKTNFIKDKYFINYNKWCINQEYRKMISKPFVNKSHYLDEGRLIVPKNGGGSSFDLMKYEEKGNEMRTQERWLLMLDDPEYMKIFENKKLIELSENIYPNLTAKVLSAIK